MKRLLLISLFVIVCLAFLLSSCKKEKITTKDILKNGIWKEKNNPFFNRSIKFNESDLIFYRQGSIDTFYYSLNKTDDTLVMIPVNNLYPNESYHYFNIENQNKLTIHGLSVAVGFQPSIDVFYNEN